jgi:hypothetical protein
VETDLKHRGIGPTRARIVFNGDFNWFNGVRRDSFVTFNQRIMAMVKENKAICTAGNIEAELAVKVTGTSEASGCGCAYPSYVNDRVVANSDQIMSNFMKLTADSDIKHGTKVYLIISSWLVTIYIMPVMFGAWLYLLELLVLVDDYDDYDYLLLHACMYKSCLSRTKKSPTLWTGSAPFLSTPGCTSVVVMTLLRITIISITSIVINTMTRMIIITTIIVIINSIIKIKISSIKSSVISCM